MTESQLIRRCRRGDREAQRELYARTSERIYGLLLKMTRNPEDAFDLAHDTYILAYQRIDQFDGRGPVAAWLSRIAVNEALQFFRRAERERSHLKLIRLEEATADRPDDQAAGIDMDAALGELEPTDRAVLVLRYREGMDYRQIAEAMGCRDGTVASRLNRAREKLRAILQDGYGPSEENPGGEHPLNRKVGGQGT